MNNEILLYAQIRFYSTYGRDFWKKRSCGLLSLARILKDCVLSTAWPKSKICLLIELLGSLLLIKSNEYVFGLDIKPLNRTALRFFREYTLVVNSSQKSIFCCWKVNLSLMAVAVSSFSIWPTEIRYYWFSLLCFATLQRSQKFNAIYPTHTHSSKYHSYGWITEWFWTQTIISRPTFS